MSQESISEHTLYLIQASYASAPLALSKLQQLYTDGDQVVLMGESVMHAAHDSIQALEKCYVLENEQPLLKPLQKNIQLIDYAAFAELCLQFTRSISLK
ncbi:DsrH/TusB family sulfur metabolism protein [Acinetobacter pragensis]|uniref:DsrH/TusB family sulfur metabolism protein n=1 Tax=Acinetobacter pragensis TaxID=1806892 RepID=UPI0033409464